MERGGDANPRRKIKVARYVRVTSRRTPKLFCAAFSNCRKIEHRKSGKTYIIYLQLLYVRHKRAKLNPVHNILYILVGEKKE